jgi:hypothetical protein
MMRCDIDSKGGPKFYGRLLEYHLGRIAQNKIIDR